MTGLKYTKPYIAQYPSDFDPKVHGYAIHGFTTLLLAESGFFEDAVRRMLNVTPTQEVLLTTRDHWSGYSEFTITNEWSEIIVTIPSRNYEKEWPSMGDFLRAVAEANPEADR